MKKSTGSACALGVIMALITVMPERQDLRMSDDGLQLIAEFEGCESSAYLCPAGVATIGFGHTKDVKAGDVANNQQIGKYLIDDIKSSERCVNEKLNGKNMPQRVFDAHVSLVFNVGCYGVTYNKKLRRATYLAQNAQRSDWVNTCNLITDFNKAAGKVSKGLERRRAAEKQLCLSGITT